MTYWNDNGPVCFIDNDIESGQEHCSSLEVNSKGGKIAIHVPKTALLYREMYGWVDRTNQQAAYYNTDRKTVRKQNRVLDALIETYALVNTHTVWLNSLNLISSISRDDRSSSNFRFRIIRAWYAKCRMHNCRSEILRNPTSASKCKRNIESVLMSPRRGRHNQIRLSNLDAPGKERILHCRMCGMKTTQKCEKCSRLGDPVALCDNKLTERDCWNLFHGGREYDNMDSESSQSQV